MNVTLTKVNKNEKKLLNNLMQLYLHDLSLYFSIDFDSKTCQYKYNLEAYFYNNYAYFIKVNNEIVGFILINKLEEDNYEISEIFILNNYKNKKIGKKAVNQIFDIYKGKWQIKVVPSSPKAESFWKKTISTYTDNNYKLIHTGKYNRAEFYFNNKTTKI